MHTSLRAAIVAALLTGAATPIAAAPRTATALDDGWQARIAPSDSAAATAHKEQTRWFPAHVPAASSRI